MPHPTQVSLVISGLSLRGSHGMARLLFVPPGVLHPVHAQCRCLLQYHCYRDCLWSPYVIGQTIIFSSCSFFLLLSSFFFPRLISAVGDWMFTILWHMAWP